MPAILTHDLFGQDAYGSALAHVDLYTPDERDAFLLGSQGPDPLFYLALMPPLEDFRVLGSTMHTQPPTDMFLQLRQAVDAQPERDQPVARAYFAGFTCHYLLDRAVHPLVYYWERGITSAGVAELDASDGGVVHAEIERDLDEMVLYTKRNQTIATYRPYEEVLRGRDATLAVIGDVYANSVMIPIAQGEPTVRKVYPLAVSSFRLAQSLFWAPGGRKTKLLSLMEKPVRKKRYSLVRAMSHRVRAELTSDYDNREHRQWTNPFTRQTTNASFWDLYEQALDQVSWALSLALGEEFDECAARELTGGLNFSGEPVE